MLLIGTEIDTRLWFKLQLCTLRLLVMMLSVNRYELLALDAAICSVRPSIASGVVFETRDLIKIVVSVLRETLKSTLMLELVTTISLLVSGTEDANVHSSSSFATLVLLCAKLDVGAERAPPSKSTAAGADDGGLTDC